MRLLHLTVFLIAGYCAAEDEGERPALMERLVQSLPQIPNVIKGQMEGKPDELKKMISSMLGNGLLSELVVNPMGVAENMGVPLNDLGINKTVMEGMNLGGASSDGKSSTSAPFNIFSAFTPSTTTTKKIMYVDGVPISNFDDFIRKHNLEDSGYSTSAPPVTTTQFSPERIAEVVLERLKSRETPILAEPPRQPDISNSIDMNSIDPSRVAEVNRLLRRAPQRFDPSPPPMNFGQPLDIGPPGFGQSLDPAVDEVVTNLRTKSGYDLSVDEVKRLQNILQNYEQTLQTKELLTKRKQLQVLQTELTEQRKRIDLQKKMEEDLRKKEKELEEAKMKMELQLNEQLSNWHSAFGPMPPKAQLSLPQQMTQLGMPPAPMTTTEMPSFVTESPEQTEPPALSSSHEQKLSEEREEIVEQQMMPVPVQSKISSALRNRIRYSPIPVTEEPDVIPPSTSVKSDDDEFVSKCDCEKISLDKMDGKWLIALASQGTVQQLISRTSIPLDKKSPELTCSRFDISTGKQSIAAQDARLIWQFRTKGASKLFRLRGNALTMDHESVRVQMADFDGENFSFPFCVLRSGGTSKSYEHMLVTNSQGDCKDVALLVRDPQEFFDNPDKKLQKYLKNKIARKQMNSLDVVDFNDC